MTIYLSLALVLLVASAVQGVLGFGFGMLSMSFAVMLFPMQEAVPLVTGYALLVNVYLVYQLRRSIMHRGLWPIVLGGLAGMPIGVMLLKHMQEGLLLLTLGAVMITHVLWSLRQADPSAIDPGRGWALFAGSCSGALGASLGTAGPPVVMYGSTKPWDKDQLRGTLQAFFLVCCCVQMTLYCFAGLMTMELLHYNLVLAPTVVVGGVLGLRFSRGLNQEAFGKLVLGGLFVLSLSFIGRGLIDLGVF
jgi:uncharacterized membrane protein YfcA